MTLTVTMPLSQKVLETLAFVNIVIETGSLVSPG